MVLVRPAGKSCKQPETRFACGSSSGRRDSCIRADVTGSVRRRWSSSPFWSNQTPTFHLVQPQHLGSLSFLLILSFLPHRSPTAEPETRACADARAHRLNNLPLSPNTSCSFGSCSHTVAFSPLLWSEGIPPLFHPCVRPEQTEAPGCGAAGSFVSRRSSPFPGGRRCGLCALLRFPLLWLQVCQHFDACNKNVWRSCALPCFVYLRCTRTDVR